MLFYKAILFCNIQDDYLERLEAWHETRTTEEIEEGSLYEELDGGLKVPVSIWKRLYHYQKVIYDTN